MLRKFYKNQSRLRRSPAVLAWILFAGLLFKVPHVAATFYYVDYSLTSSSDLQNLVVGDSFSIDVTLLDLPVAPDYDAIFNMNVLPSTNVFSEAFGLVEYLPGEPHRFEPLMPPEEPWLNGVALGYIETTNPLSWGGDLPVFSFEMTALAAGTGFFQAEGADVFHFNSGADGLRTNNGTLEFTVSNDVSTPATLSLLGIALAGLGWTRRKKA
jgi:hypothetical protein